MLPIKGKIFKNTRSGYAIIELIFYISLFAVLSLLVINSMISMTRSFKETVVQSEILSSITVLERISREVRQASNISSISGSSLALDTTDDSGASRTVEFALSGDDVEFRESGVLTGNLNTPNISITALSFTEITGGEGQAVKIVMTVVSENDSKQRAYDFHNTIVLRDSY
ncbi:MAG: hypothetical protein WD991_00830 [Candidatus Paceibacterota bacterium]